LLRSNLLQLRASHARTLQRLVPVYRKLGPFHHGAVLCAECDVVSDSPHDICLVCGSRSLFNIARILGGSLPKERASLVTEETAEIASSAVVLSFPKPHRPRRKAAVGSRQLVLEENEADEVKRGMLFGPKGR
jgi:hypothetical protein